MSYLCNVPSLDLQCRIRDVAVNFGCYNVGCSMWRKYFNLQCGMRDVGVHF